MTDRFASYTPGLEAPAQDVFEVTPNDTTDLPQATRAINVSLSGAVRLTSVSGTTATVFVAAGVAFPVRAQRIFATGTSATGIVGMA